MNDRRIICLLATIVLLWLALGFYIKFGDTAVIVGLLALVAVAILAGPFVGLIFIWRLARWLNRRAGPRYAKRPFDES